MGDRIVRGVLLFLAIAVAAHALCIHMLADRIGKLEEAQKEERK